jgi:hypothetical protein
VNAENEFPVDVRCFVLANIASVPHLEALMLLRSAAPKRWSAGLLAKRLYVRREVATAVLDDLARAGMLGADGEMFFYEVANGELAGLVERLAGFYATHLVQLTLLIHSARPNGQRY